MAIYSVLIISGEQWRVVVQANNIAEAEQRALDSVSCGPGWCSFVNADGELERMPGRPRLSSPEATTRIIKSKRLARRFDKHAQT